MQELIIIQRMPTAYAAGANSQQGRPVSDADAQALRTHERHLNRRSYSAKEAASKRIAHLWQHSPRTRKRS